ncbi:MAG: hypothetical protein ACHQ50_16725 [Fimbriimonadales bacterium]
MPVMSSSPHVAPNTIKLIHTLVWVFFAACILAIPIAAARAQYSVAALLIGLVALEPVVLAQSSNSPAHELGTVRNHVVENRAKLITAWHEYFAR